MSHTSPDLSQTLQNLSQNFPGATPGEAGLPPQSIDSRIQALLKGQLAQGDKIARLTDIISTLESVTNGGAPNNTNRKLSVVGDTRQYTNYNIPLLNGFSGEFSLFVSEAAVALYSYLSVPAAGAAPGTLIANLPLNLFTCFLSGMTPNNGSKANDQVYVYNSGFYVYNVTAGASLQIAGTCQRAS